MKNDIRQKLFISAVLIALIWQASIGFYILKEIEEVRISKLNECMANDFKMFDFCYKLINNESTPSIQNFIKPFIPSIILIWINWLFKFEISYSFLNVRKSIVKFTEWIFFIATLIAFIFPILIVYFKNGQSLYEDSIKNLFVIPWLALCFVSAPLVINQVYVIEDEVGFFNKIKKCNLLIVISPFIGLIYLIVRQQFNL